MLKLWHILDPWNNIKFSVKIVDSIDRFAIISSTDANGTIDYVNDNFCEISGYTLNELFGANHRLINSGFHPPEFFKILWSTIKSGKVWHGEVQNKAKGGATYWVRAHIIPITNADGSVIRYLSFGMDITKEKKDQAELEAERVRNIHLGRLTSLGELASNVAHEINNPLTVIGGSLDMLRRSLAKEPNTPTNSTTNLDRIGRALKQVDRITKIIQGLRRFSRQDDHQVKRPTMLKDILVSVTDLCAEKLRTGSVQLNTESAQGLAIVCNSIQIEQVLVNLITNSIDAVRSEPDRWINLKSILVGNFVEIEVVDSGSGIKPEFAKRLAEPFFTTKGPGKGTGLGLSISRTILQQHGGELSYDAASPNTRFVIRLPALSELPVAQAA
ncbi:MAG: PAS domain-containing sensor histidine kinase [Deltaproteobacteria bacterium]|nr:PAS domain-containing sensor histidine kinase [Deltaproteobacteria bacterium]